MKLEKTKLLDNHYKQIKGSKVGKPGKILNKNECGLDLSKEPLVKPDYSIAKLSSLSEKL